MSIRATLPQIGAGLAALATAAAAIVAAPATVSASANGCVGHGLKGQRDVTSCVTVHGAGTFVDSVAGGVDMSPYTSAEGHFHVSGGGLDFTSADALYENRSFKANTKYGPTFTVGHDVPSGSNICASFIEKSGAAYTTHSPACVSVHR
jgi:hypothetical protein